MAAFSIRPLSSTDREWVKELLVQRWGSSQIVSRGHLHEASQLAGFAAFSNDTPAGLVTYRIHQRNCEVVSLDSLLEGSGIGSALIEAVVQVAQTESCRRVWLITTNDNLVALRFYQKRGFTLHTVHRQALVATRRIKPSLPQTGLHGIPLRDEIELELILP